MIRTVAVVGRKDLGDCVTLLSCPPMAWKETDPAMHVWCHPSLCILFYFTLYSFCLSSNLNGYYGLVFSIVFLHSICFFLCPLVFHINRLGRAYGCIFNSTEDHSRMCCRVSARRRSDENDIRPETFERDMQHWSGFEVSEILLRTKAILNPLCLCALLGPLTFLPLAGHSLTKGLSAYARQ